MSNKILSLSDFLEFKAKNLQDKKIVFTNGCFDILHPGHTDYLTKARELGDILIVGLNADASIQRLKGPARPIQDLIARGLILSALASVDYIISFDTDTPLELITAIQPDVLVKGGDYTEENIVGAEEVKKAGGQLAIIPFLEGYSTTQIVNKIKE